MNKTEILSSDLPPVEKIWEIAKERSDITTGYYGAVATASDGGYVYEPLGGCCCPIGAVVIGERCAGGFSRTAGGLLGVTEQWVDSFIDGFDGTASTSPPDLDGLLAGQDIRRRFVAMGVSLG